MACCTLESRSATPRIALKDDEMGHFPDSHGVPLLVTPARISRQDADRGSFADFVDRTLADVREALVSEHNQRVHANGSVATDVASKLSWDLMPASQPGTTDRATTLSGDLMPASQQGTTDRASNRSWDLMPASQPGTWEELPGAHAATARVTECGTQTQVDWSWPWMQFPLDGRCKSVISSHADVYSPEFRQTFSTEQQDIHKSVARPFGSMTSDEFRARNEELAKRIQRNSTRSWKRVVVRGKKEPLELMDAAMGWLIIANAIAIGVSSDTKHWKHGWLILDSIFVIIFIFELSVKIYLVGFRGYFWSADFFWAWFETVLVITSLAEILLTLSVSNSSILNGSTILRVVRLVRLVKILRVCRVPMASDLVMMVHGLFGGVYTLVSALFLVVFPLFMFALVMRETLGEEPIVSGRGATSFNTLPKAYFNTFRCLVVDDCADENGRPIFVLVAATYGWFYGIVYSLTLVLLKFGLYNVIIAIFVEKTVQAAKYNATYQKRARLNDQIMFKEKSLEMAELAYSLKMGVPQEKVSFKLTLDEIENLELSKEEFTLLCHNVEFKELLSALDVAEDDHLDLFDTLDVDAGGTLSLDEIVNGIAKLRGDARKSDIVAVILLTKHLSRNLSEFMAQTTEVLQGQRRQLKSIQTALQPIFSANAPSLSEDNPSS